ncbi:MAG TPA: transglutaminase domain-containing protein [Rubrobacteraceae bacterium]|nr:transglutaminase domain-containing protein [Rubrobacteraceae bacterium]
MRGARVWLPLCAAGLAAGGAFSILFTGDTYDGSTGGFTGSSLVALTGYGAFWTMLFAALCAVLVGSAGSYRFVLVLPTAALYTQLAVYGLPPFLSLTGWRRHLLEVGGDVYRAADTMYSEPIPYDLAPGLLVVLIPVVIIVVAFATSATLYEESPIFSIVVLGVTIGVLSTISFEAGAGPFFFVFLVSALALLLVTGGTGHMGRAAVAAGLAVAALVLVLPKAPFADQTVSNGLIDWTRIGTGGTSQLDVQADVGDYLTYGRDTELFRVRSPEALYWRAGTLDYFDGAQWRDTTDPGLSYGEEISPEIETQIVPQYFTVMNSEMRRIFGAYKIVQPSLDPSDMQQNSDGSWSAERPLTEGSEYRVISEVPQPTEAQLRSAGTAYPREIRDKYLQLPDNPPEAVAATADRIRRNYSTRTPYDTARAIEKYLVYDGNFTYNLNVNYRRADQAIEEFLGDGKEGFCTQFATSMVLIAREMGMPSRVVYGATSGEEVAENEYAVTGANMHLWVEIYFPNVGWYPFNPTPGFTTPSTMEANAPRPRVSGNPANLIPDNQAQRQNQQQEQRTPQEKQKEAPAKKDQKSSGSGVTLPAWPLYALVPALLAAAVPLTKRALLARGRPEDLYRDLTGRLRDVPSSGGAIADSPALTPNERLRLLAGAAGVEEGPFAEFGRAYSAHLYSAEGRRSTGRAVSAAYRRAVRAYETIPLWRRALGAVNPASLGARAARSFAAASAGAAKRARARFQRLRRR